MTNYFDHCVISKLRQGTQGTQKLMGEHLKVVWAKLQL
jgi:predicted RNA-binding protein associated with RNAse of E/G family